MTPSPHEVLDQADRLADEGQLEEAVNLYETVLRELEERDEIVTVLVSQINCLCDLGRTKEARSRLKKASELLPSDSPNFPHIQVAETRILVAEGATEQALRILNQLAASKEKCLQAENGVRLHHAVLLWRLSVLVDKARYQEAHRILDEVLNSGVDEISVPYYAGMCYYGLGQYQLAKKHFEEALRGGLPPVWEWEVRGYLAPIYYSEGALAKAKLQYERMEALQIEANAPREEREKVFGWLAKICLELGDNSEAARYDQLAKDVG